MNSNHDRQRGKVEEGEVNVCFKEGSLLTPVFKNENPELPFYLITTSVTFVFNLSKIIIFTEDHMWAKPELENQAGPFVLPALMSTQRGIWFLLPPPVWTRVPTYVTNNMRRDCRQPVGTGPRDRYQEKKVPIPPDSPCATESSYFKHWTSYLFIYFYWSIYSCFTILC